MLINRIAIYILLFSFANFIGILNAFQDSSCNLFNDLMIVEYWNNKLNERLPVTYNNLLIGGYFNMPSARMGKEGEIGAGFSLVPPYRNYNVRMQLLDRLEVTGSYRVFKGVDDPILTPLGFGDLSDKGANFKLSLFHPEDSDYVLPGLAIGLEDFMGTKNFHARYLVLTKVWLDYNLEFSLGYGQKRYKGFFGGLLWMPYRKCGNPYLENISLGLEYDATPYKDATIEKHPEGRKTKTPFNFGIKYRLFDQLDFSLSYIRGREFAIAASTYYNLGETKGLLPKINNPLPYKAPIIQEPISWRRPEDSLVQDFNYALLGQGFELLEIQISFDDCIGTTLRLKILNNRYFLEREVRQRLDHILANLIPSNVDKIIVVIEAEGFSIQEYHYNGTSLRCYALQEIGDHELHVMTPLKEVTHTPYARYLFYRPQDLYNFELHPKYHAFFGSAKGKFKYALGLSADFNGFLPHDIYYSVSLGYIALSSLSNISSMDRLNPSKLPNVRTDIVDYYKQKGLTLDEAYLQKTWNLSKGYYTRLALGYFEEEYAGLANEWLYYPVNASLALGLEGAVFKKRTHRGIGFTDKVRQLDGYTPYYHKFFFYQYFGNFYYHWKAARLDFKVSAGKFLANDYGARFEIARYFPSGLKISLWYTMTNGNDKINGSTYYDKGIAFSMPLDIFYTHSDRARFGYGMSAWLRDVGVAAETGKKLYDMIREQRN